jgi:hypothetical protein
MISSAECFFARGIVMPSFGCFQSAEFSLMPWTRLKGAGHGITGQILGSLRLRKSAVIDLSAPESSSPPLIMLKVQRLSRACARNAERTHLRLW